MPNMNQVIKSRGFKRFIALLIIFVFLYAMKSMINLMLFTFVFTYLIDSVAKFIINRFDGKIKINYKLTIIVVALLVTAMIFIIAIDFLPLVFEQFRQVVKQVLKQINELYNSSEHNEIIGFIKEKFDKIYGTIFSTEGINYIIQSITNISRMGINIVIALLLSIFFLLDKDEIIEFTYKFKQSKISEICIEIQFFWGKFISSFGKVIEVQIIIATINGILSTIGLSIIGFPHLLGFGMMVMLLGLIPVAGVIISLVPLSIVAFNNGGLIYVVYILIMIALLHAFEAYILNPKLMSSKTKLPIFYTLSILLVSEHIAGVVGLIVGIPIFMFILDIIEVPYITQKNTKEY
jgi:predicted PurR-regulated permease PerM